LSRTLIIFAYAKSDLVVIIKRFYDY